MSNVFIFSAILSTESGFLGDNFVLITCFLTFNLTAMIGNITASLCQFVSYLNIKYFIIVRTNICVVNSYELVADSGDVL